MYSLEKERIRTLSARRRKQTFSTTRIIPSNTMVRWINIILILFSKYVYRNGRKRNWWTVKRLLENFEKTIFSKIVETTNRSKLYLSNGFFRTWIKVMFRPLRLFIKSFFHLKNQNFLLDWFLLTTSTIQWDSMFQTKAFGRVSILLLLLNTT